MTTNVVGVYCNIGSFKSPPQLKSTGPGVCTMIAGITSLPPRELLRPCAHSTLA